MARSLNKVQLIGNLTRDPELRYTPSGAAVCTIGIATNRQWTTDTGEKKDAAEFHRLVAWQKLAEICGQYLKKGRRIYVEGRLQTRKWQGQDGADRYTTEIVISDMIMLDGGGGAYQDDSFDIPDDMMPDEDQSKSSTQKGGGKSSKKGSKSKSEGKGKGKSQNSKATKKTSDEEDEDIPF